MPRTARNPNDFFPKVLADFVEYEALRVAMKKTTNDPVHLKLVLQKSAFMGKTDIQHEIPNRLSEFHAEKSTKSQLKYALKIFVPSFGGAPCFRFDSAAHIHVNAEDGNGLEGRDVAAPHLHKVDSDGWMRAYRTPQLADPESAEEISESTALGTNLFCQEFNLVPPGGGSVVLETVDQCPLFVMGKLDSAHLPP